MKLKVTFTSINNKQNNNTMKTINARKELEPVVICDDELSEPQHFLGFVRLFGKYFEVEGSSYAYSVGTEYDENGSPMWDNTETSISISNMVSGEAGEVEYNSTLLRTVLIRKIEGRF